MNTTTISSPLRITAARCRLARLWVRGARTAHGLTVGESATARRELDKLDGVSPPPWGDSGSWALPGSSNRRLRIFLRRRELPATAVFRPENSSPVSFESFQTKFKPSEFHEAFVNQKMVLTVCILRVSASSNFHTKRDGRLTDR